MAASFDGETLDLMVVSLSPTLGVGFTLKKANQGAWVAQSVKCQTLDLGSGHDLTVVVFSHNHVCVCVCVCVCV